MSEPHDDPRIYFAAERTFLAWIRTGLALMGVGFAVSRFGLFLRQLRLAPGVPIQSTGVSVHSGVALVALGIIVNVVATVYHVRTIRALRTGTWTFGVSRQAIVLALLLAAVGVVMAVYLLMLA